MFIYLLKSASLLDLQSQRQRILTEHNMNTTATKEGLSQGSSVGFSKELFETLSKPL